MDTLFQSDINGVLEHLANNKDKALSASDLLYESLHATLAHFQHSSEAQTACHGVLYSACFRAKEFRSNFSVSRYSRGVSHKEYYAVVERLNLVNSMKIALYKQPVQASVEALQLVLPHVHSNRLHVYMPLYVRICRSIEESEQFAKAIKFLGGRTGHIQYTDARTPCEIVADLLDLYETDTAERAHKGGHEDLLLYAPKSAASTFLLEHTAGTPHCRSSERSVPISPSPDFQQGYDWDVVEEWEARKNAGASDLALHICAFALQISDVLRRAVPSCGDPDDLVRNGAITRDFLLQWQAACTIILTFVMQSVSEAPSEDNGIDSDMDQRRKHAIWLAIDWMLHLRGSWRSVMQVMVQFPAMLFLDEIDTECTQAFAKLVHLAELHEDFCNAYIQPDYDVLVGVDTILRVDQACEMLTTLMSTEQLNFVRDRLYVKRYSRGRITVHEILLHCWTPEDTAIIKRCLNQITADTDVSMPDVDETSMPMDLDGDNDNGTGSDLVHTLAKLSLKWPFKVVDELVSACLKNENQQEPTVQLLAQLGNLCMLRSEGPISQTLLTIVVKRRQRDGCYSSLAKFIRRAYFADDQQGKSLFFDPHFGTAKRQNLFDPISWVEDILQYLSDYLGEPSVFTLQALINEDGTDLAENGPRTTPPLFKHIDLGGLLVALTKAIRNTDRGARKKVDALTRTYDTELRTAAMESLQFFVNAIVWDEVPEAMAKVVDMVKKLGNKSVAAKQMLLTWQEWLPSSIPLVRINRLQDELITEMLGKHVIDYMDPRLERALRLIFLYGPFSHALMEKVKTIVPALLSFDDDCANWKSASVWVECLALNTHPAPGVFTEEQVIRIVSQVLPTMLGLADVPALFANYIRSDEQKTLMSRFQEAIGMPGGNQQQEMTRLLTLKLLLDVAIWPKTHEFDWEHWKGDVGLFPPAEPYFMSCIAKSVHMTLDLPVQAERALGHPKHAMVVAQDMELMRFNDASGRTASDDDSANSHSLFYPFHDAATVAKRTMCVLMLPDLLQLHVNMYKETSWQIWRPIVMDIVQFLGEHAERQAAASVRQPKSIYTKWKKAAGQPRARVIIRPLLDSTEQAIIAPHVANLPDTGDRDAITAALMLNNTHDQTDDRVLYYK
ncbi:hypothetical protein BC940DRAFT_287303 [Gongronella butleri]|nr:hypothetical protein BC940DRAFT_287303 [Gongronella butleri]